MQKSFPLVKTILPSLPLSCSFFSHFNLYPYLVQAKTLKPYLVQAKSLKPSLSLSRFKWRFPALSACQSPPFYPRRFDSPIVKGIPTLLLFFAPSNTATSLSMALESQRQGCLFALPSRRSSPAPTSLSSESLSQKFPKPPSKSLTVILS